MNKPNLTLLISILVLVLLSIGFGISYMHAMYWITVSLLILISLVLYNLIRIFRQNQSDIQKLAKAIHCFDPSFSSKQNLNNYGSKQWLDNLDKALILFDKTIQEKEANLNFYDKLLNQIDSAIIVVDKQDTIVWVNETTFEMMDKSQIDKIADFKKVLPDFAALLKNMMPKEVKNITLKKKLSESNLAITMHIIDVKGEEMKVFGMKNIQTVLDETESEAWKKSTNVLTQEMLRLVTPIMSLAETFSDREGIEYDHEMLSKAMYTVHRRSKALVQLIANYRQLSEIPTPNLQEVEVKNIVDEVSDLLKTEQIIFSHDIEPQNLTIKADREQMERVLINMILNAWEASHGSKEANVDLKVRMDKNQRLNMSISDNGSGIMPDITDKIFVPFFTTKKDGLGIGLSICREIITAHGGTISVVSEEKKGTCFTIKL